MKERRKKSKRQAITRRDFLKTISGTAASVFVLSSCSETQSNQPENETTVYGPRYGIINPYVNNMGKPILVCVSGNNFNEMLSRGLEALGGLNRLVTGNQDVLIKPNLLEKSPYPWISSVDSIKGIINAVQKVSSGNVYIGDMSYEDTSTVYQYLNLQSEINSTGATLLKFFETYKVRRNTWAQSKPDYDVYADVYDAPVIISTCVLKRHVWAFFTNAIKNNVGTITGSGQSGSRSYMHNESENFLTELAEVAGLINPDLNIVDARSIITLRGPSFSQGGKVVNTNKMILCGDIVATDAYCARIMAENDNDFSASDIKLTLDRAELLGLGTSDLNQVEIIEINT